MTTPEAQFTLAERLAIAQHVYGIHMDRWARACWKMFNAFAFRAPADVTANQAAQAIAMAAMLLPCHICRGHMQDYVQKFPVPTSSWGALRTWLVTFHNSVSQRTNRPEMKLQDVAAEESQETEQSTLEHWWGFMFAVTALFVPSKDAEAVKAFLRESLPLLPAAARPAAGWEADVTSADALLSSLQQIPSCPHKDRFSFLADYVPPGMLGHQHFPVSENERTELKRLFEVRTKGHKETMKRAFDRVSGASAKPFNSFIEPLAAAGVDATSTDSGSNGGGSGLTGGQIAGIVVACVCFVILLVLLLLIFIKRKPKPKTTSPQNLGSVRRNPGGQQ